MGSNSRCEWNAKVTGREAGEAHSRHMIADLLDDYPGIDAPVIASWLGEILRCTAIELNAGRDVPIGTRRAVRHLDDAVGGEMEPPAQPA